MGAELLWVLTQKGGVSPPSPPFPLPTPSPPHLDILSGLVVRQIVCRLVILMWGGWRFRKQSFWRSVFCRDLEPKGRRKFGDFYTGGGAPKVYTNMAFPPNRNISNKPSAPGIGLWILSLDLGLGIEIWGLGLWLLFSRLCLYPHVIPFPLKS